MVPHPWAFTFCVFALLAVLGVGSGFVKERLWLSEPLICALVGIAIGPGALGLIKLDPLGGEGSVHVLRVAARVTLAIAVTGAAMRLPAGWVRARWRGLAVALGPGMFLMWIAGTALAAVALTLPLLPAAMIGGALAPIDPVLAASILTGGLSRRALPDDVRFGLTAESAANDGLGLALVMLPVLLSLHAPGHAWTEWLGHVLLWQIAGGVAIGAAAGWLARELMRWARGRPEAEHASLLTVTIALALTTLAAARMLEMDGVLAAFVAGLLCKDAERNDEQEERHERFSQALSRFFELPVLILFGAAIPWHDWVGLGWRGVGFALLILAFRRLPAWLLLARWMPWSRSVPRAVFTGWFGPVGIAALVYAMEIQEKTGLSVWPAVSLAVGASVVAHGVTATPFSNVLGRVREVRGRREQDVIEQQLGQNAHS